MLCVVCDMSYVICLFMLQRVADFHSADVAPSAGQFRYQSGSVLQSDAERCSADVTSFDCQF